MRNFSQLEEAGSEDSDDAATDSAFTSCCKTYRPEDLLDKVRSDVKAGKKKDEKDPLTEAWIKAKLYEWDAKRTGDYDEEEVALAMKDYHDALTKNNKVLVVGILWCCIIALLVLLCTITIFVCAVYLSKEIAVTKGAEMVNAKNTFGAAQPRTNVHTSEDHSRGDLSDLLSFDPNTDQWLLPDDRLRYLESVSFSTENGSYYSMKLAEVIRFDAGRGNTTSAMDKIEILTLAGDRIRYWENISEPEIKFDGTSMWQTIQFDSSRRLTMDVEGYEDMEDEEDDLEQPLRRLWEEDEEQDLEQPPRRLWGKGGIVYVGGLGGGGGHGYRSCSGTCNVPHTVGANVASSTCHHYCLPNQCYTYPTVGGAMATYKCASGAFFSSVPTMLWPCLVLLEIWYAFQAQR
jgi:hypothetical protein